MNEEPEGRGDDLGAQCTKRDQHFPLEEQSLRRGRYGIERTPMNEELLATVPRSAGILESAAKRAYN